jgi:hypothetical protein
MGDPVHELKAAGRRARWIEAEQGDHAVHVDHEKGLIHSFYLRAPGTFTDVALGSRLLSSPTSGVLESADSRLHVALPSIYVRQRTEAPVLAPDEHS